MKSANGVYVIGQSLDVLLEGIAVVSASNLHDDAAHEEIAHESEIPISQKSKKMFRVDLKNLS